MRTGSLRTRWSRRRFSEGYAVRISVKISRVCFSGAGRMITSKPCEGFDCIIRPAPSGAGRTTPSQSGHYHLNLSPVANVVLTGVVIMTSWNDIPCRVTDHLWWESTGDRWGPVTGEDVPPWQRACQAYFVGLCLILNKRWKRQWSCRNWRFHDARTYDNTVVSAGTILHANFGIRWYVSLAIVEYDFTDQTRWSQKTLPPPPPTPHPPKKNTTPPKKKHAKCHTNSRLNLFCFSLSKMSL